MNDMGWKGKYKSEILMVCHMDAKAMHEAGAISDKEMQEYDQDCLISPLKRNSASIKAPSQKPTPIYANSQKP